MVLVAGVDQLVPVTVTSTAAPPLTRTLAPPEHVEHDATAADPWRMAVSAWIVVEEHRWLELDVLMRNAPPVVFWLFDTQYPSIVWKPTSYALPLPRSATNESQLRKLPVLAITAGRLSLLRKWTSLPRLKWMLLALWMYHPNDGRVPMLFGL